MTVLQIERSVVMEMTRNIYCRISDIINRATHAGENIYYRIAGIINSAMQLGGCRAKLENV